MKDGYGYGYGGGNGFCLFLRKEVGRIYKETRNNYA
jgi:hypothetical protein